MEKLKKVLPALVLLSVLLGLWSLIVVRSESAIFPTPWKVVTGTAELISDGTMFGHIAASLLRVGAGFLIAAAVALPLGLWMGRVTIVYRTLYAYMIRLKREDFERPDQRAALVKASGLKEADFVARFGYLVGAAAARPASA